MDDQTRAEIKLVVQEVLRRGDFELSAAYDHMTPDEWGKKDREFRDRVETRQEVLESHVEEVATVLLGTPRTDFQGGGRDDDGMCHRMDKLDRKMSSIDSKLDNGGLRVKLPWQFYTAITATIATIIVAIIQTHG